MAKILDTRTGLDKTIRIYDSFYSFDLVVNPAQFDIVNGYFTSVCATKQIADNFTAVLFRIAQETGENVLDLLGYIQGSNSKLEMNQVICYYLNSFKSRTSLYGTSVVPQPNQFIQRNIVQ